jgi:hypothetical protein
MIKTFPVPTWICQRVRLSSLLFVVLTYIGAVTQSYALEGKTVLEKKISLEVKSVKLKRVLAMLESKADVRFVYSPNAIDVHQSLSLSVFSRNY